MEMGLKSRTAWAARVQKARWLNTACEDATRVLGSRRLGLLPGSQGLRGLGCPLAPRVGPDFRLGSFTSGDKSLPPPLEIMYRFPIALLKTVGPIERGDAPGLGS